MNPAHTLYYTRPASAWNEALPLGCGSLGALVYGRCDTERILLNHDTLWAGLPIKNDYKQNGIYVGAARELIDAGEYALADALIEKRMLGENAEAYLPLGHLELFFQQENVRDYTLSLDLSRALYTCDYRVGDAAFHREGFCSHPHQVFFQKFSCENGRLSLGVSLCSELKASCHIENGVLILRGYAPIHSVGANDNHFRTVYDNTPHAVCNRFEARVAIQTDGKVCEDGAMLRVTDATYIVLYQTADTSFVDWKTPPTKDPSVACAARLKRAVREGYERAKELHLADYTALYDRCELTLSQSKHSTLPTDERIRCFATDTEDAALCALYFHFGRYLMISAERAGSMPGNLQGIWNWSRKPIWECDMHTNINLQMNYWGAESSHLSECRLSLLTFLRGLCESGKKTARDLQGCRGSCAYSTTDIWCKTTPTSGCAVWGYWPMGEAWLAMDIFDHYEYTLDLDFLAEYYDILRENALFLYDWCYFDTALSAYVTSPSTSPEHFFHYEKEGVDKSAAASKASTGDLAIVREIFSDFIKAAALLGRDAAFAAQLQARLQQLLPYASDADGLLREWAFDFSPHERGHRHFSHLIGVYPGEHLNPKEEPKLFEAARAALRERLEPGDTGTGWSCVWAMALLARFGEGEQLAARLSDLLCKHTSPNLLDYMYVEGWPEPLVFQIDANLGACAAMTEMLASSRAGEIELLPALPAFWQSGAVRGLRVKGAASLSLAWKEGELCSAELTAQKGGTFCLRYAKGQLSVTLKAGERLSLSRKDFS